MAEMMASNLGYFEARMAADEDYVAYISQPGLRAMMLHRMEAFIRYLNDYTDSGTVATDIALVRSAQQWAEPDDWTRWADRTRGRFTLHQGVGRHAHMTEGSNLGENAAIIRAILRAHGIGHGGERDTPRDGDSRDTPPRSGGGRKHLPAAVRPLLSSATGPHALQGR